MKENIIQQRSFAFAIKIVELYQSLKSEKEYIIAKQLLKSGTSIGANVEEASAGQSKKDFITKMAIASKEARETKYWLKLLKETQLTDTNLSSFISEIDEIINILTAIVKTSQKSIKK